jgi:hypothetical protein
MTKRPDGAIANTARTSSIERREDHNSCGVVYVGEKLQMTDRPKLKILPQERVRSLWRSAMQDIPRHVLGCISPENLELAASIPERTKATCKVANHAPQSLFIVTCSAWSVLVHFEVETRSSVVSDMSQIGHSSHSSLRDSFGFRRLTTVVNRRGSIPHNAR